MKGKQYLQSPAIIERFKQELHSNTNSVCQLSLSSLFPFHDYQLPCTDILLESEEKAITRLSAHTITESSISLVGCYLASLWFCADSKERCPLRSEQSKLPWMSHSWLWIPLHQLKIQLVPWKMLSPTHHLPLHSHPPPNFLYLSSFSALSSASWILWDPNSTLPGP